MMITKTTLSKWAESMCVNMTEAQKNAILERFGEEPEPYEWSEQDIVVQIRNFLGCGEFVKPINDNSEFSRALQGDRESLVLEGFEEF